MSNQYVESFWRDAKPEDVAKEPPMVARFCCSGETTWSVQVLNGYNRKLRTPWRGDELWYHNCQVYDPPTGFKIGDGYELIDITKTTKQECDEYWLSDRWVKADSYPFRSNEVYRRRISPQYKYIPFTWEDLPMFWGREILTKNGDYQHKRVINDCIGFNSGILMINGNESTWLAEHAVFCDTNEPFGKKVKI